MAAFALLFVMTEDVPKTDHLTHVDRAILYSLVCFLWLAAESFAISVLANRFGFHGTGGDNTLEGGSAQRWDMTLGAFGVVRGQAHCYLFFFRHSLTHLTELTFFLKGSYFFPSFAHTPNGTTFLFNSKGNLPLGQRGFPAAESHGAAPHGARARR